MTKKTKIIFLKNELSSKKFFLSWHTLSVIYTCTSLNIWCFEIKITITCKTGRKKKQWIFFSFKNQNVSLRKIFNSFAKSHKCMITNLNCSTMHILYSISSWSVAIWHIFDRLHNIFISSDFITLHVLH